MRKPIKYKKWYQGKTPIIQIKILKSIVTYGQLSKTTASNVLNSDYKDVSKAMKALENNRLIILSSSASTTHNKKKGRPERMYKISNSGLSALLIKEVAAYLSPAKFWKIILILIKSGKNWFDDNEFGRCYNAFERDRIGFSSENMHCALFQLDFIRNMMSALINVRESAGNRSSTTNGRYCIIIPSLHQVALECLAINGPLTLRQLANNSNINEQEIKGFLNKYCPNDDEEHFVLTGDIVSATDSNIIDIYFDYLVNIFSINRKSRNKNGETVYELSLIGAILVLMLVRNRYSPMVDDNDYHGNDENLINANEDVTPEQVRLFYNDIGLQGYYDRIAHNYDKTLPLIFGKWEFLKGIFGSRFLYDTFDFFIYPQDYAQFALTSVRLGGKKEFYDNLVSATENSLAKLYIIQHAGKTVLENFEQKYAELKYDPKIIPIRKKLNSIEAILKIASITLFLQNRLLIKTSGSIHIPFLASMWTKPWNLTTEDITSIENVLKDELSFFYYLCLDTIVYRARTSLLINKPDYPKELFQFGSPQHALRKISQRALRKIFDHLKELNQFGSPQRALRKILCEDKEIDLMFKEFMNSITGYQHLTTQSMDDIYNEVIRSQRNTKDKKPIIIVDDDHEEYDLSNILYTKE